MTLDRMLLEILACPQDKGPLFYFADESFLYNPRLHRRYEVRDDIPIMLIDEAVTVDDREHERLMSKVRAEGLSPTFDADEESSTGSPVGGAGAAAVGTGTDPQAGVDTKGSGASAEDQRGGGR